MTIPRRVGVTIPLAGPLHAQRDRMVELADLGYSDVWTAEADGADGLTPLALASVWEPPAAVLGGWGGGRVADEEWDFSHEWFS